MERRTSEESGSPSIGHTRRPHVSRAAIRPCLFVDDGIVCVHGLIHPQRSANGHDLGGGTADAPGPGPGGGANHLRVPRSLLFHARAKANKLTDSVVGRFMLTLFRSRLGMIDQTCQDSDCAPDKGRTTFQCPELNRFRAGL